MLRRGSPLWLPFVRTAFGRVLPFLLWCAAVWRLSSESDPRGTLRFPWEVPDKAVHLLVFAAGGFLAVRAFRGLRRVAPWSAAVVVCTFWGVVDEFHQSFVPRRSSEWEDVVADALGAAAGAALAAWFHARRRSPASPQA